MSVFSWDLFQLEYPDSWEDYFSKKEYDKKLLFRRGKEELEDLLVRKNELKKVYEDDTSNENFIKTLWRILSKYKNSLLEFSITKPKD